MSDTIDVVAIPITHDTIVETAFEMKLGTSNLLLPEGDALCTDAVSLTIVTAEWSHNSEKIVIIVAVAEHDGALLGSLSPMTPAQARSLADTLVHSADSIDGGPNG